MGQYLKLGFEHILPLGIDHILFLLCLVVPIRSFLALVPIVTSFTIAHSITFPLAGLVLLGHHPVPSHGYDTVGEAFQHDSGVEDDVALRWCRVHPLAR